MGPPHYLNWIRKLKLTLQDILRIDESPRSPRTRPFALIMYPYLGTVQTE